MCVWIKNQNSIESLDTEKFTSLVNWHVETVQDDLFMKNVKNLINTFAGKLVNVSYF